MTEIPKFSPGCFGSALAFKKDDTVCRSCVYASQCELAHLEARDQLRARYGIKPSAELYAERRQEMAAAKLAQEQAVAADALALPKKTVELLARLDRGQYDVVGKLGRGENPFGSAIPFMRVVCHLLLKGLLLNQATLTTAFAQKFEWQQQTAAAHARMAIQALDHIGAVQNNDGVISLRRG